MNTNTEKLTNVTYNMLKGITLDKVKGYDPDYGVITEMIEHWDDAKSIIRDMFRKHPCWDEEQQMIHFANTESGFVDYEAAKGFARYLTANVDYGHKGDVTCKIHNLIYACCRASFIDTSDDDQVKSFNLLAGMGDYHIRNDMKITRIVKKVLDAEEIRDLFPETYTNHDGQERRIFDREYAKFADALSPHTVKRHTCLSIHPCDYLLMSHGTNWESCHSIIDYGCYSSGTISYLRDETSFVYYTVNEEYADSDIFLAPKSARQMFFYEDGAIVQSRAYPQSMDVGASAVYKANRLLVEKVIADCLGEDNLWETPIRGGRNVQEYVITGDYAMCYEDWRSGAIGNQHVRMTKLKSRAGDFPMITVGAKSICICCGEGNEGDYIQCYRCGGGKRYECEQCGEIVDIDETIGVGDYRYCRDCACGCDRCGDGVLYDDSYTVKVNGSYSRYEETWCENCVGAHSSVCVCGERWRDCDLETDDDGNAYCPDCVKEHRCKACGNLFLDLDSDGLCENCAETLEDNGEV